MWSLFQTLGEGLLSWLKGRQELKKVRLENQKVVEQAEAEAKAKSIIKKAEAEADWDQEALRQSQFSWKDEYLVIILSLPFLGSFIPEVQDFVSVGWDYLDKAPEWYQLSFIGLVTASFGLRWLLGNFGSNKNSKKE